MSPKMKINEDQTDKQLISLIKTLLETRKGEEFDGITAARFFSETWAIYADWHIFSSCLDQMCNNGMAARSRSRGHDGFTLYIIN